MSSRHCSHLYKDLDVDVEVIFTGSDVRRYFKKYHIETFDDIKNIMENHMKNHNIVLEKNVEISDCQIEITQDDFNEIKDDFLNDYNGKYFEEPKYLEDEYKIELLQKAYKKYNLQELEKMLNL